MLSLLVATTLTSSSPSLQLRSSKHDRPVVHQQLRGGADAPAPSPPATAPAPTALTPEQITEKLNGVPVFCILNKEGGIISMRDPDGGEQPVCRWFVDANEATMVLKAAVEANPGVEGLHIGVHGLGNAFKLCGGWTDEVMPEVKATLSTGGDSQSVSFRLQGNHALVQETSKQLQDSLKSDGFDALAWQLPIFFSEELQSRAIFPVFFHPADLAEAWLKAGRSKETVPEKMNMMDVRSFVSMLQKPDNPWQLVQFVASRAAIKLAKGEPLDDPAAVAAAGGGGAAAAGSGAAVDDDDDDDGLLGQQEEEEL